MAITLDGTTGITTPDLTDTSLTAGRVVYAGTSGNLTGSTALTFDGAILGVNGISVGRGAGAVATTTAVGASALAANSSGGNNVAIGYQAGLANSTGGQSTLIGSQAGLAGTDLDYVTAVGYQALSSITSGDFNTALGAQALKANTSASYNTALGYQAGYTNITGAGSTYLGYSAGYSATGASNTFVGAGAGDGVTSGAKNSIIGRYNGNQGGLDIRTASNYIVLSDGDGNPRAYSDGNGNWTIPGNIKQQPIKSFQAGASTATVTLLGGGTYILCVRSQSGGYATSTYTAMYMSTGNQWTGTAGGSNIIAIGGNTAAYSVTNTSTDSSGYYTVTFTNTDSSRAYADVSVIRVM